MDELVIRMSTSSGLIPENGKYNVRVRFNHSQYMMSLHMWGNLKFFTTFRTTKQNPSSLSVESAAGTLADQDCMAAASLQHLSQRQSKVKLQHVQMTVQWVTAAGSKAASKGA